MQTYQRIIFGFGYTMSVAANVSSVQQQGNLQLFDPYLDSRWTLRGSWILHRTTIYRK